MNIVQYVWQLMQSCPHLRVHPLDFHVDETEVAPDTYSIDSVPGTSVEKQYLDGSAMKQYTFVLSARKPTCSDGERLENIRLYQQVSDWMDRKTRMRNLPAMEDGYRAMKLQALEGGYQLEGDGGNDQARYGMQCRLHYFEKAR